MSTTQPAQSALVESANVSFPLSADLNGFNFEQSSLCFPKELFYAATFDVDSFLAHYKRDVTLEKLRNDLSIFLKVLELSMSDLINKDYPDFVNLSTNLVDLDKAINDLKRPLETIKLEVDNVKNSIDKEIELIMSKLNEKLMIEKKRIVLKLLINWQRSLKVTNEMMGGNSTGENSSQKITGDHIERIAFEFCQLKNSLTICSGENNEIPSQNNEIEKLSQMLEKKMQELFLDCLNLREDFTCLNENYPGLTDSELQQQLKHVLKSYALLSKQRESEQLFSNAVVKPYMSMYINESYLETNILNLNGIFEKILEFFDLNSEFLRLTCEIKNNSQLNTSDSHQVGKASNEFDFIINSIWSNVVASIDFNLNVIFSASDPDLFHQRYLEAFEFLNKFEFKCFQFDKEIKNRLKTSNSYKYFVKKWPIQVYFQIRFQEIVLKLEEDLLNYQELCALPEASLDDHDLNDLDQNIFNLKISSTLINQMEYCWQESKCFLKSLLSNFWKLNLQLVSRYSYYFIQMFQTKISLLDKENNDAKLEEQLQTGLAVENENESSTVNSLTKNQPINDIKLAVLLLFDAHKLQTLKLPNFLDGIIAPIMRSAHAMKDITLIKEAFNCSLNSLNELQQVLIDFIVRTKSNDCFMYLKNANDIPRLYRRTNREIPRAASTYISLTVQVVTDFKQLYALNKSKRQQDQIEKCIQSIIDSICIKYQSVASDLLESVKKMEDSLKRLHKVRQNKNASSATLSASGSSASSGTISDDDKIRLQLALDINEFGKQLEEKCDGYKGDSNYESLCKLVEEINQNMSNFQTSVATTDQGNNNEI